MQNGLHVFILFSLYNFNFNNFKMAFFTISKETHLYDRIEPLIPLSYTLTHHYQHYFSNKHFETGRILLWFIITL